MIAYEPIWAIGTGQVADARAGPGGDRVRPRAGRPTARPSRPQRTRVLYGGSVKPDNAAELLALPDVDGALVGGASLDAESFAAIVARRRLMSRCLPGPGALPAPAAVLVVLDGWGLAPDGPGQRRLAGPTPVFDELWARTRTRR